MHLDNVAIVRLGDYYSGISVFKESRKKHGTKLLISGLRFSRTAENYKSRAQSAESGASWQAG